MTDLTYFSDCYLGGQTEFLFRTLLQAAGEIDGERYVYARFVDEEDAPPGEVPDWFKRDAAQAFERTIERLERAAG